VSFFSPVCAVEDAGLDIIEAAPCKLMPGSVGFRVQFGGKADPGRLRVLLDLDDRIKGEPHTRADHMIEGPTFYKYPLSASGWQWETVMPVVVSHVKDNVILFLVPRAPPMEDFQWAVQTTRPDWSPADRFPPEGMLSSTYGDLPVTDEIRRPEPEDMSALISHMPAFLSPRFEEEIAKRQWQQDPLESLTSPTWFAPPFEEPLLVVMTLTDVVSGESALLQPGRSWTAGASRRWRGEAMGVAWDLIALVDANGHLQLSGRLQDDRERCLSLGVGCRADLEGWTWHDDVRYRREIRPSSDPYDNTSGSPYGLRGEQSIYPFGVVGDDTGAIVVETDPGEPRVCRICVETTPPFFGVYYDLALTPLTKKFPGEATFRCAFRSCEATGNAAFRRALNDFYSRYPAFHERRVPRAGLWMPFSDPSRIPEADDFGFAFYEKGGPRGADVDYCRQHGILNLIYTEPWLYWLPMARNAERFYDNAVDLMRILSITAVGEHAERAASALLGGSTGTNGNIRLRFIDVPWNSGARMEVSTDPELATTEEDPVNRAMSEWRFISAALEDERVDGIYLDSMSAMAEVDYNPAAMAVADIPCVFESEVLKPGAGTRLAAFEFTAGLGNYLHSQGKYLMGNFPCWRFPFFMQYIDVPGEETCWYAAGRYNRMSDRDLNFRRAISGGKPWGFLQAARFDKVSQAQIEMYFKDCLFWAFMPSFFSHDGANEPYWEDKHLYERDRHLFRTYLPITRRLAEAGWRPEGPVACGNSSVWIEHYGETNGPLYHITVRNTAKKPIRATLDIQGVEKAILVVDPFSGNVVRVEPDNKGVGHANIMLPSSAIGTRDLVSPAGLANEIAFMRNWRSGGNEAEASLRTLESIAREQALGAEVEIRRPTPLLRGRRNALVVEVNNRGELPFSLSAGSIANGTNTTEMKMLSKKSSPPGETAIMGGMFLIGEEDQMSPVRVSWSLNRGGETTLCERVFRSHTVAPVEASSSGGRFTGVGEETGIPIMLLNHTDQSRGVTLVCTGDFSTEDIEVEMAPEEIRDVEIPVVCDHPARGKVRVTARTGNRTIYTKEFVIEFLPDDVSLVRDSRTVVEVDSTYGGYSTKPLTDGVIDVRNVDWNNAAWASAEAARNHWVRMNFAKASSVSNVTIYWHTEGDTTHTSQRGRLLGWREDGTRIEIATFANDDTSPATHLEFDPIELSAIELRQPGDGGPAKRPRIMWLREIEVH